MTDNPETTRTDRPSLVWPILLIALGVILLLSNLNLLPENSLALLASLWPLAIILLGLDLIIGRRSTLGMVISGLIALLIVAAVIAILVLAPSIPGLDRLSAGAELKTEQISTPLEGVESARVRIDWGSGPGFLQASPSSSQNLIEGQIAYTGSLVFDVNTRGEQSSVLLDTTSTSFGFFNFSSENDREWDLSLHPSVTYDLGLDTGSGACDFDLSDLALSEFALDSGSGSISLALPAGDYAAEIDGGSGSIDIIFPSGAAVRVDLDSGSGSFDPGPELALEEGEENDDSVWETPGFDQADDRILLEIDQGSGSINIDSR